MEEYSPYKVVHYQDKLNEMRNGDSIYPVHIHFVPSNRCNHRCTFCAYRMKDYLSNETFQERDLIPYDRVVDLLYEFNSLGVKAIQVTGGGEPLVHPRIYDIFRLILDLGMDLALVTNGSKLTPKLCELLGDASWVRVSLDAFDPRTYSLIRQVPKEAYAKVLDNIRTLLRFKKDNIIGVGFVVCKDNYNEVSPAVPFFKDMGVDNFRISAAFTPKGIDYFGTSSMMEEAKMICMMAEELSDEKFKVFNNFNDRFQDLFDGTQDYDFCGMKDFVTYVGADQNVYTCCTLAYNHKGLIGSIKNQTFKELWDSRDKQELFDRIIPRIYCQHPCLWRGKNLFINYCLKDNPKHVTFV